MKLTGATLFRLTRDGEAEVEDDEADDPSATWSASSSGSAVISL